MTRRAATACAAASATAGNSSAGSGPVLPAPSWRAPLLNMNEGAGLALLVPGGLFEVVFLPIWLIAKGFRSPSPAREFATPALASTR
jgi:hypothetical protein